MRVRIFFVAFAGANLGLVLYGAMGLARPDVLLSGFTLHVFELPATETGALAYLAGLFRLLGFFNLLLGSVGLYLLVRCARGAEPWVYRLLVGTSMLSYAAPILFDLTVGTMGPFEVVEIVLFAAMLCGVVLLGTDPEGSRRLLSSTGRTGDR